MAGKVIEILSTRKLVMLFMFLLIVQIIFFLIGGLIAPPPARAQEHIMTNCIPEGNKSGVVTRQNCDPVTDLQGVKVTGLDPSDLVLIAHIPRNLGIMTMTPWFQYLLALLQVKITYKTNNPYVSHAPMRLDIHILYSNEDSSAVRRDKLAWKTLARCEEDRILECNFNHDFDEEHEDYEYDCELLHLFQLGSIPHKRYLINLRLPVDVTEDGGMYNQFGNAKEMSVIAIHQNGGFTQVWTSLKSVMTVLMIFPVIWFWRRIKLLERKPLLIEKAIFSLGISILFLNIPIELISIFIEAPWMLFFTDIRQGFFYGILLGFWIIFTGEHMVNPSQRNKLSTYRFHLSAIFISLFALLAFDIAERGMQLVNPCSTVWTHHNFAMILIVVASVAGCIYFLLLCYMVVKVFRIMSYKQRFITSIQANNFQTVVFRFRLLMILSISTAALTIVFYILSQKYDGMLDFGDHRVEVNSAFFTGVYGLWNIYVFLVLSVYAPSHKQFDVDDTDEMDSRQELIELHQTPGGDGAQSQITDQIRILELTHQKSAED
uniref:protein wntless homolog n=1 Tax=Styela clava TaxID=7725 RepID=UPI00193A833C|nr:protein wntless homolog [Styela clava]